MHADIHGNALHARQLSCVDHVNDARIRPYADQHAAAIFSDGEVIRPSDERDFLFNLSAFSIDYIEHAVRFVADVNARSIGSDSNAMRLLYTPAYFHNDIGDRI